MVDSFYFPVDMAHWFFVDFSKFEPVYGDITLGALLSRHSGIIRAVSRLNVYGIKEFLKACSDIELCDTLFVPCKYDDFDFYRSNGIWKTSRWMYQCVANTGEVLGYLLLDCSLYSCKSTYIVMIQTVKSRAGYGTRIVNTLKSRGIHLRGMSTCDAEGFWGKQGAVFQEHNRFYI